jgi:transposase
MSIVGGLDLHRAQITFDYVDTSTGEVHTGRVQPACRETFARFLAGLPGPDADFVVEGCTGWWFVAEELARAGMRAHVADPAEMAARRGRKKRAKTDRADARHGRQLLMEGRVPESWIPPHHVMETRALGRLYLDLIQARNAWAQRTHATLFHHGTPAVSSDLSVPDHQDVVLELAQALPAANRHAVQVALTQIRAITGELAVVHRQLVWIGRHQPGAKALQQLYGVGELVGPLVWAEMGDARRFSSSRQAVRHTGLDITVYDSNGKRSGGHLARQGPGVLRWALYEAGQAATHRAAPDHAYYRDVKARHGHTIATLSVARKIARRCYHVLVALGDRALEPPTSLRARPVLAPAA